MKTPFILCANLWLVLLTGYISSFFNDDMADKGSKSLIIKAHKEKEEMEKNQEAKFAYHDVAKKQQEHCSAVFSKTAQTIIKLIKEKDYNSIMNRLDKLSLPKGDSLFIEECTQNGMGDHSRIFVKTPEETRDEDIWNYIKVEDSVEGAWQAFLLHKMWHTLPLFWHANYASRTYLYSKVDDPDIIPIYDKNPNLIKDVVNPLIVDPDVVKSSTGKYYVSCCFWTDFGGLILETVEVSISSDNSASFKDLEGKILYKYDCGILF